MTSFFRTPSSPPRSSVDDRAGVRPLWQVLVVALALLLLGVGIGIVSSRSADRKLQSAEGRITTLESQLAAAEASNVILTRGSASLKSDKGALQTVKSTLDKQNAALVKRVAKLRATTKSAVGDARAAAAKVKIRQAQLDARERALNAANASLDRRQRAVSGLERSWQAGTIHGDGIFVVGTDIVAGVYRADASPSGTCYYARLSALSGGSPRNVIASSRVAGPLTLSVHSGDTALELRGCADFHKVS